jgi:hypothetical protein
MKCGWIGDSFLTLPTYTERIADQTQRSLGIG